MGRKRPTNKLTIQKVWVENDPGSTKRGSNIEVRRRLSDIDLHLFAGLKKKASFTSHQFCD